MINWDLISQIGLTVLSVSAIVLVAKKNKWGFVAGLLAQPFWFYTSFIHRQWGIFITTVLFTGSFILGIYEWFYKGKKKKN